MITTERIGQAFQATARMMELRREDMNKSDPINGNHGDHMVEIFQVASRASRAGENLAEAMQRAADELDRLQGNGTAQVYSRGLGGFAEQFRKYNLSLDDLLPYLKNVLRVREGSEPAAAVPRAGEVLKALVGGMSTWKRLETSANTGASTPSGADFGPDMAYLFELGAAYMAAKSQGGEPAQVLAEAAVNASPLKEVDYRAQSGKSALAELLEAMAGEP